MKKSIILSHNDLCEEWIDLLKNSGYNTLGLHFTPSLATMEEYLTWLNTKGRPLIERLEAEGIGVEHELHVLSYLLPRSEFEAHPAWFRVGSNGERTAKHNCCLSSPEALALIEENAYTLARELRQTGRRYYLWSDDATDSWCHCPLCRDLSNSDQNLVLLSAMLKGIRRYDPAAEICFLAYLGTIDPPTKPIPEGIFLEFAPIKRNMFKPLTDEENREHCKSVERLLQTFPAERAEILEYWMDVSLFTKWGKLPLDKVPSLPEVWRADLDYYASLGVCAIKTFGVFMGKEYLDRFGAEEILAFGEMLKSF